MSKGRGRVVEEEGLAVTISDRPQQRLSQAHAFVLNPGGQKMGTLLLRSSTSSTWLRFLVILVVAVGTVAGWAGAQVVDQGNSVETCIGCHAAGQPIQVSTELP